MGREAGSCRPGSTGRPADPAVRAVARGNRDRSTEAARRKVPGRRPTPAGRSPATNRKSAAPPCPPRRLPPASAPCPAPPQKPNRKTRADACGSALPARAYGATQAKPKTRPARRHPAPPERRTPGRAPRRTTDSCRPTSATSALSRAGPPERTGSLPPAPDNAAGRCLRRSSARRPCRP